MIYKIGITFIGDDFYPKETINQLKGDFIVMSQKSPTENDFGFLDLCHKYKFATEEHVLNYESAYVDFILNNKDIFSAFKITDIHLFYEIYYDGFQCNFSILSSSQLKDISCFNISLPVSTYKLSQRKISLWSKEIKKSWGNI